MKNREIKFKVGKLIGFYFWPILAIEYDKKNYYSDDFAICIYFLNFGAGVAFNRIKKNNYGNMER
jgi:hypothetical protein